MKITYDDAVRALTSTALSSDTMPSAEMLRDIEASYDECLFPTAGESAVRRAAHHFVDYQIKQAKRQLKEVKVESVRATLQLEIRKWQAQRPPAQEFIITVRPVRRLFLCAGAIEERTKGLIGFHAYERCPDCKVMDAGFELWGENGHLQGTSPERPSAEWRANYDNIGRRDTRMTRTVFVDSEFGHTYLG